MFNLQEEVEIKVRGVKCYITVACPHCGAPFRLHVLEGIRAFMCSCYGSVFVFTKGATSESGLLIKARDMFFRRVGKIPIATDTTTIEVAGNLHIKVAVAWDPPPQK